MIGEALGWSALGIACLMTVFTTSKLSKVVFIYLLALTLSNSFLDTIGQFYIYPAIFITVCIQWSLIMYIALYDRIRAFYAPIAVGIAMFYGTVCLTENIFGLNYAWQHYDLILGTSALIAALEGIYHGGEPRHIANRANAHIDRRAHSSLPRVISGRENN